MSNLENAPVNIKIIMLRSLADYLQLPGGRSAGGGRQREEEGLVGGHVPALENEPSGFNKFQSFCILRPAYHLRPTVGVRELELQSSPVLNYPCFFWNIREGNVFSLQMICFYSFHHSSIMNVALQLALFRELSIAEFFLRVLMIILLKTTLLLIHVVNLVLTDCYC